jgi:hypothetical protein
VAELELQSLTDAEIHRSVYETVLSVLLPAIPTDAEWARATAVQLAGLVRYAAQRDADRTEERVAELAQLLDHLSGNAIVASAWDSDRSQRSVMAAAGSALAAAVGRDDAAATEVRSVLRPVIVRQLDDELAQTAPLVDAFRGKLDDGRPT